MTINEAKQYLIALKHCETCYSNDTNDCKACEYHQKGSSAKCYDAIDVGIDTIRKYQKICKILDKQDNGEQHMYDTIQEIEEVRDGNVDWRSNSYIKRTSKNT